ncbi:MBL fold metallo-hydrolase [Acidovorax sp. NCPPB 3576]|uniref:MBL fold metallo-hydrolase n=1 Tax=Acidovorax sp. NCPPB 3576 TaxID=2940488 RepID=UPI0023490364|nr:MBL fold metallo-hydrolase [Acidovorax sp. NCPPB 3576]WCM88390.1 MBL fold metallo-hydrolase [Acidovorax sp. NCPPB 3576]
MPRTTSVQPFFDSATGTVTYLVWDLATRCAAVIDPVLDFDAAAGRTATRSADAVLACVRERGLTVQWILETHAHADHLSAAPYLQAQAGGRIAVGEHIRAVQAAFGRLFPAETGAADGSPFDHLLRDGETLLLGATPLIALWVPGHTPADMAYLVDGAAFVGDTLFMPDVGTARADFPGGDAATLYRSIQRLLALPGNTRVFVCHDYPPAGREPQWETTVQAQREDNIHVGGGVAEADFVALRRARDATLGAPALLLPSLQVNVRAGQLPAAEANGIAYLRIPLNAFGTPPAT